MTKAAPPAIRFTADLRSISLSAFISRLLDVVDAVEFEQRMPALHVAPLFPRAARAFAEKRIIRTPRNCGQPVAY